jgi:tRNA-Thr(GGU) m(6)t(6)A37 methyltransferase TsaA
MTEIRMAPIGIVRSPIAEPVDDVWGGVISKIALDSSQFGPACLAGLEALSHIEVIFCFHMVSPAEVEAGARHPRGRQDWPEAGFLAQRGKNRPNRIGVTVCRLIAVAGMSLTVNGLDAIDGTPVPDIKPYLREFAPREPVRQPPWASELMKDYWT